MKRLLIIMMLFFPVSGWCAEFYTSTTARTQVRAIIGEATASFWSDTEIDNWIKEAVEDISARSGGFQVSDTITLVTAQYEYTTTTGSVAVADIVKVLGMVYVVTTDITGDTNQRFIGLIPIDPSMIHVLPLTENGPPKYYYHSGENIGILPPPTATENAQLIRIYFTKTSQTIADLPNQYQSLTFWYAASMAYKKEHRYAESKELYGMYLQKLSNLSKTVQVEQK